jgi:hypothetical protein
MRRHRRGRLAAAKINSAGVAGSGTEANSGWAEAPREYPAEPLPGPSEPPKLARQVFVHCLIAADILAPIHVVGGVDRAVELKSPAPRGTGRISGRGPDSADQAPAQDEQRANHEGVPAQQLQILSSSSTSCRGSISCSSSGTTPTGCGKWTIFGANGRITPGALR